MAGLNEILTVLLNVLALLGIITPAVQQAAKEHFQYVIETAVIAILSKIQDPVSGLPMIASNIASDAGIINGKLDGLAAQIAAFTPVPTVVSLPSTPPPGYGGATADEVWGYVPVGLYKSTSDLISIAGIFPLWFRAETSAVVPMVASGEGWLLNGDFANSTDTAPNLGGIVPVQLTSILATDLTYMDWLNRVAPTMGVTLDSGRAFYWPGSGDWYFYCAYSESDFKMYQELTFGSGAVVAPVAPVWPGIALVTLGTPVALDLAVNVNVPMDGVLIALSATPPNKPTYQIGDALATAHIGQIAFKDDNGDLEYPQNLSFPNELYVPLHMAHATGVKIRTIPGVSGTVTPWVVSP